MTYTSSKHVLYLPKDDSGRIINSLTFRLESLEKEREKEERSLEGKVDEFFTAEVKTLPLDMISMLKKEISSVMKGYYSSPLFKDSEKDKYRDQVVSKLANLEDKIKNYSVSTNKADINMFMNLNRQLYTILKSIYHFGQVLMSESKAYLEASNPHNPPHNKKEIYKVVEFVVPTLEDYSNKVIDVLNDFVEAKKKSETLNFDYETFLELWEKATSIKKEINSYELHHDLTDY